MARFRYIMVIALRTGDNKDDDNSNNNNNNNHMFIVCVLTC